MRWARKCLRPLWIVWLGLSVLITALMIVSGRWWIDWSSAIAADGSQRHLTFRFGAVRWMSGERGTIAVGSPPGWHADDMGRATWDWWPPAIHIDSHVSLIWIPLWMVLPLFLVPGIIGAWRGAKRSDADSS